MTLPAIGLRVTPVEIETKRTPASNDVVPRMVSRGFRETPLSDVLGAIDDRVDDPRVERPRPPNECTTRWGNAPFEFASPLQAKRRCPSNPEMVETMWEFWLVFLWGAFTSSSSIASASLLPKTTRSDNAVPRMVPRDFRGTPLPDASRRASMIEFTILALTDRVPHASRAFSDNGFRTFGPQ